MAELLRVEPGLFNPETEAWFVYDDGRRYLRPIHAQEQSERGPVIMSDHIDPVLSHADGKTYDSKSALYRSYTPGGNPQGVRYECIGERVAQPYQRRSSTVDERMQAVKRALGDL